MADSAWHNRNNATPREAFLARMEAQCTQIERYRLKVMQEEGRHLGVDEAAKEWIERYAEGFAQENDSTGEELLSPE